MVIDIEEGEIKQGLLALVMALVEVIRDALKTQAVNRMENQTLTDDECERLGRSLIELDGAIEQIEAEQDIGKSVKDIRNALDDVIADATDTLINQVGLLREKREKGLENGNGRKDLIRI